MIPGSVWHPSVPLAIREDDGQTLWPRRAHRSADEAIAAHEEIGFGTIDDGPVRLVWAHQVINHPEGEWWLWTSHPGRLPDFDEDWPERELAWPPVECWAIGGEE